jgi:pimeloyl-ACP methyl ester carboxylesterase
VSFVKTKDGVEIYYKDWGKGQPIVFSHGWPLSGDDWAGPLSAKLLKHGTLKTYKDFPHGMPTTQADTINADLLAFLKA